MACTDPAVRECLIQCGIQPEAPQPTPHCRGLLRAREFDSLFRVLGDLPLACRVGCQGCDAVCCGLQGHELAQLCDHLASKGDTARLAEVLQATNETRRVYSSVAREGRVSSYLALMDCA